MTTLATYLPQDRLRALARGETLPDRTTGSALFADISGFTPLTEHLALQLGPRQGIEELSRQINTVYDALIAEVERYGGSVISFAGDAITCWFDGKRELESQRIGEFSDSPILPSSFRAVACALTLQTVMRQFANLALKVAVTSGAARRWVVGDPNIQLLDTLAGETIARLAEGEHLAQKGEVLIDRATAETLGDGTHIAEWRTEKFAVVRQLSGVSHQLSVVTDNWSLITDNSALRPYLLPAIYEREQSGHGVFLTELRPVTALFLRFVGLDYDDDAQAGDKLNALIARAQTIITRYAGALLQVAIGDKGSYLYAAFGAPTAHEDDPRRATQAALELQQSLAALDFTPPPQIGISRGVMRVGAYGGATRRTYGVLGDDVNLAARLMQAAAPGEILVSGRMQAATADAFVFEANPPLSLKGKTDKIPAFVVVETFRRRALRLPEPHYALPMVGRGEELRLIHTKLELTLHGHAQIIGLVAEAGLGKSRLAAEIIRAARQRGFVGYGGACLSDALDTPYQVWKTVWQAFFNLDPVAPLEHRQQALAHAVAARAPERAQALPLLSVLLELALPENDFTRTLEPQYKQSALHTLLGNCLRATARETPLLILLEDVHWIDALSHDLFEELARSLNDCRVCLVIVYRPPQLARIAAPRVERLPNFTRLELQALTPAEAEQALRAKLAQLYPAARGALPTALVEKLIARTQGNPFYLEELLNYLRDRGLNPLTLGDLDKVDLPDNVHALILSRIDQLSEKEKTILRVASVVGRLFQAQWLIGYYPDLGNLAAVKRDLDQLAKLDITPLDTPEPELAYLFKHIITHEVTYESLPFATRAQLHEQLAQFIEALGADHYVDLLARHYGLSNNLVKQRLYLQKAGEAAEAIFATTTAIEYYTRLLPLLDDPQAQAALHIRLADLHTSLANYPAVQAAAEAAAHLATSPSTQTAALTVLCFLMCYQHGEYLEARTRLTAALPDVRVLGDPDVLARVLDALGSICLTLGDFSTARAYFEEHLALARGAQNSTFSAVIALYSLAALAMQSDLIEAERLYEETHTLALSIGYRERALFALSDLSEVHKRRGNWTKAYQLRQQALALARELGQRNIVAINLLNMSDDLVVLQDYAAARVALREGLALARELGAISWMIVAVYFFASVLAAEGNPTRALALMGLCQRHPALPSDSRGEIADIIARWKLNPTTVEAGLTSAESAALDFDEVVEAITLELTQST